MSRTDFQNITESLQAHLEALRTLESGDEEAAAEHLRTLATEANSAADRLERADAGEDAQGEPSGGGVKGVSEDLEETTDKNIEHVKEELEKPLGQLRDKDDTSG